MYELARRALFGLDPEIAHELSLDLLGAAERLRLLKWLAAPVASDPVKVMGLTFPNRVGLAAGLDKNGDCFNALGALGFGFVEIGTATPRPQPGNAAPRLFRLPEQRAIINRMGFNNKGVDHLVARVQRRRYRGVLGVNLGKNRDTPELRALEDYRAGMRKVYSLADYIAINISSPNTPGLRNLQFGDALNKLLEGIKREQAELRQTRGHYVPVAVKIAPDMSDAELAGVAGALLEQGIDGVIATNTTVGREGVEGLPHAGEAGGLSGAPLAARSTAVIAQLYAHLGDRLPIIGVGGICRGADAAAKIEAGASLVQIYSGFIYRGPALVAEVADAVASLKNHRAALVN